jgi:glycosyltransferase involved in cell wall biosynthesis
MLGGTERFIASLAASTEVLGVESRVLCSDRHPHGAGRDPTIPVLRVPTYGPDRLQVTRAVRTDVDAWIDWADVLHFHDLRFGLDLRARRAAARRTASVLSTHGLIFHTDDDRWVKQLAWRHGYLRILRSLDAVIADSEADFERVEELPRAVLLENPVDVSAFARVAETTPPENGPLLFFGRLAPNKAVELLAPVLRRDATLSLVITGAGTAEYSRDLTRAFDGLDVRFTGEIDDERLVAELRGCTAVVLPSRAEGYGLTLVEAMATARPVVAADIPTYRAIARDTDVILTDFSDPAGVARALRAAVDAGSTARSVARAHERSWTAQAPRYAAVYADAIAHRDAVANG